MPPVTYVYPSSAELRTVEQSLLPTITADDPIFSILPIEEVEDTRLIWEIEGDYTGLQQPRGINGQPGIVAEIGTNRLSADPGVYGEYMMLDEEDLLRRRQFGTWNQRINLDDLVARIQVRLLDRRIARLKYIGWTLVTTGAFSVSGPNGVVLHKDQFTLQSYTASVAWATTATATPLADFRAMKLKQRGYSLDFGAGATAYMNQTTFNAMIANTNTADLYGKRTSGLANVLSLADVNMVLAGEGLPHIQIYEGGYKADSTGTWTQFVADNKVVVVGARPGNRPLGNYRMTLNLNNNPPMGAPGPYTRVVAVTDEIPVQVQVHDGHNGGPVLYYPSGIIVASV
jgi:hypothetical protein